MSAPSDGFRRSRLSTRRPTSLWADNSSAAASRSTWNACAMPQYQSRRSRSDRGLLMPQITFIISNGSRRAVDAKTGDSVMQAAIKNSVPGIDADCGGACACATCHVYVDESWMGRLSPISEIEAAMLDIVQVVRPNSRLSCQLQVTDSIDGLVVSMPESQH